MVEAQGSCPACGNDLSDLAQFCDVCGLRVDEGTHNTTQLVRCLDCASELPANAHFCDACGLRVAEPSNPRTVPCPSCNREIPVGGRFCDSCGTLAPESEPTRGSAVDVLAPLKRRCPSCGNSSMRATPFCDLCGTQIAKELNDPSGPPSQPIVQPRESRGHSAGDIEHERLRRKPGAILVASAVAMAALAAAVSALIVTRQAGGNIEQGSLRAAGILIPRPSANSMVANAEGKLISEPSTVLHYGIRWSGPAANGSYLGNTQVTADGRADFSKRVATWTANLPAELGGRTQVVYSGSNVYIHSKVFRAGQGGGTWVQLAASSMRRLHSLGDVADLIVTLDPFAVVSMEALSTPVVSGARTQRADASDRATLEAASLTKRRNGFLTAQVFGSCGTATSTAQSTFSTAQISSIRESGTSAFNEFAKEMTYWNGVALQAGVGVGGLLSVEEAVQAYKGVDLIVDNYYCPAAKSSVDLPSVSSVTDIQRYLTLDPCVIGTWRLTSPIVQPISGPFGAYGTLKGLQDSTLTIHEDGSTILDFFSGQTMTILQNPEGIPALEAAEVQVVGASANEITANPDTRFMAWANQDDFTSMDVLAASFGGAAFSAAYWTPVAGNPYAAALVPPPELSGLYSCSALMLTAPSPFGGTFTFERINNLADQVAEYNRQTGAFNDAMRTLTEDINSFSDISRRISRLTTTLDSITNEAVSLPIVPYQGPCAAYQSGMDQVRTIQMQLAPVSSSAVELQQELTSHEQSVVTDEKSLVASLADVSVASLQAVQGNAPSLSADAGAATSAATAAAGVPEQAIQSVLSVLASTTSLLQTDASNYSQSCTP